MSNQGKELSAGKTAEGGLLECIYAVRKELTFLNLDGVGLVLSVIIRRDPETGTPAVRTHLGAAGVPERAATLSALKAAVQAVAGAVDWSGADVKEIVEAFGGKVKP